MVLSSTNDMLTSNSALSVVGANSAEEQKAQEYYEYNKQVLFAKLEKVKKDTICLESSETAVVYKCNDIIEITKLNHKNGQSSMRYINSSRNIVLVKQVLETATNYARFFTLDGVKDYIRCCQMNNAELLAEYYRVPYQKYEITKHTRRLETFRCKEGIKARLLIRWAFGKLLRTLFPEFITLEEFVIWFIRNRAVLPKIEPIKLETLELLTIHE